jgi:hypothetical protein
MVHCFSTHNSRIIVNHLAARLGIIQFCSGKEVTNKEELLL